MEGLMLHLGHQGGRSGSVDGNNSADYDGRQAQEAGRTHWGRKGSDFREGNTAPGGALR